jgi:flavin reductase (DIM6/NTAB) family NADH-FMN oxidoreductase RutF
MMERALHTDDQARVEMFKEAMRRWAATVTIITAGKHGARHGITATAVTSVSTSPPSILVCINQSSRLNELIEQLPHFCVNILHREHQMHSQAFSGAAPSDDRFQTGNWDEDEDGTPYLVGAQANLFCQKKTVMTYGTHSIVIADVIDIAIRDEIAPLLYQNRAYAMSSALMP